MHTTFVGIPDLAHVPRVAVVVDVIRAFTVAAWVFEYGADEILLAESLDEALSLKAARPGSAALKDGPPMAGFDAVNSPGQLPTADLAGRTVVQKTNAGTVGALAVRHSPLVLCAGFVVAEATAQVLRSVQPSDVTFVVTGDDGRAEEDLACAEYIARRAAGEKVDHRPFVRRAAESRAAVELTEGVHQGFPGTHPDDLALCLEVDRFPFAIKATVEEPLTVLRPMRPAARA
ncbi:2-phosphosulfolactate phosphatase [Streptomyces sp. NPDC046685]|uniref:2-phosphosulfolactate phosphatase n=1 Tax=Streptomyces sp. NPDC046685 TaxID=3157202 RepID=UPI00340BF824